MKVTKVKISSHLHFAKDLVLDFTYPEGHQRAGQPLDKVCFLGQTGTGKTTLLNLIKYFICEKLAFNRTGIDEKQFVRQGIELFFIADEKHYSKVSSGEQKFEHWDHNNAAAPKPIEWIKPYEEYLDFISNQSSPLLINFPFSVVNPDDVRDDEKLRPFDAGAGELGNVSIDSRRIWDFDSHTIKSVWNIVFSRIEKYLEDYQTNKLRYFDQISANSDKAPALVAEFAKWESEHPNPIRKLADKCLNPVLQHFQLAVETDLKKYRLTQVSGRREAHVIVKNRNGDEIPHPFLSTGTKQIMLTVTPLFFLEPRNSIILFDQPETSIYPNVQSLLPGMYLDCAPENNQFFFATHSPIIASAFDPWEVVELRFDNNGEVRRKDYFKGTRHVENYYIKPKLLRWDSSYRILFDVQNENEERTEKLTELAALEEEINRTSDPEAKRTLVAKYHALAAQLDWVGL